MADLNNVTPEWIDGIRQIETTDPVLGGPPNETTGDGMVNIPHKQLAQRTQWLREELARVTNVQGILERLLDVDGAGSGLDADKLDGKHASAFLEKSGGDMAGTLNMRRNPIYDLGRLYWQVLGGGDYIEWVTTEGLEFYENGELKARIGGNNYLAGNLRIGGHIVWHAGNGGSGSGMDADTLDGQHAGHFARAADLASSTSDSAIIAAVKRQDGVGSGVDADLLDGKQASAFLDKSGGTMSGDVNMGGRDIEAIGRLVWQENDYIRWVTTEGLEFYENGKLMARIGGNNYLFGGLDAGGTLKSHNDEVMVRTAGYEVDCVVMARYTGSVDKSYGAEASGSSLQVAAASGTDDSGPINVGTWLCLGYASGSAGASGADRTTLWTRIF